MKKWGHSLKKYKFFYSIMLSGMLVAGVLIILMSIFASSNLKSMMEKELLSWKTIKLHTLQSRTENLIEQIQTSSTSLLLSSAVSDYEEPFYQILFSEKKEEETEREIENRGKLAMVMTNFTMSNPLIHSVYFYDRAAEQVVTSNGINTPLSRFRDKKWLQFAEEEQSFPIRLHTRELRQEVTGYPKLVVTMVLRTFSKGNYFIVNLDAARLTEKTFQGNEGTMDNCAHLCKPDGQIFLTNNKEALMQDFPAFDSVKNLQAAGESYVLYQEGAMFFSYSALLDCYFVETGSLLFEGIYSNEQAIWNILLIFLVGMLFIVGVTWQVYKPVKQLMHQVAGEFQSSEEELVTIAQAYSCVKNDRNELSEKMEAVKPLVRRALLNALWFESHQSEAELKKRIADTNMQIPTEQFYVVAFALSAQEEEGDSSGKYVEIMEILDRMVLEMIFGAYSQAGSYIGLIAGGDMKCLRHALCEAVRELSETNGILVTVGISDEYHYICDAGTAFRQACDIARYQRILGLGGVLAAEDIRLTKRTTFRYPVELEAQLLDAILIHDADHAGQIMRQIIDVIADPSMLIGMEQARQCLLILFGNILKQLSIAGIEMHDLLKDNVAFCDVLIYGSSREELMDVFQSLLGKIDQQLLVQRNKKNGALVRRITEYIGEHYDRDLSLDEIADHVRLSATYLSRLMKQEMGQSFTRYLTMVRLARAKELLKNRALRIEEVGIRVGYCNANYFIRIFKEKMGCTPGEYREIMLSEEEKQ